MRDMRVKEKSSGLSLSFSLEEKWEKNPSE